jgi:hypothetical protein
MCRIASLFLLKGLKGITSSDSRYFNYIEASFHQVFSPLQGKAPKEINAILTKALGEHAPSYATIKNLMVSLKVVIFPRVLRIVQDDTKQ